MRQSFLAATVAASTLMLAQQAWAFDYMAVGVGTMPCAYWLSTPQLEGEGDTWILGWWTGLNSRNDNHWVGGDTDGNGILLVVKRECRKRPNVLLMNVVDNVFKQWSIPDK